MKTFTLIKTYLKRILAFIIDYILFFIPILFMYIPLILIWTATISPFIYTENTSYVGSGGAYPIFLVLVFILPWSIVPGALFAELSNRIVYLSYLIIFSLMWTTTLFLFEFFFQRTIGKFFTHLKVCNLDGSRISFFKSFARNFIKFFFFATLPLLILPYWGGGTQGLHDKICRTNVIDAPKYSKKMHILQYVVVMIIIIIFLLAVYWFVDAFWIDLPFLEKR